MRHLYWMAQGKQKALWDHTCSTIATLMNVNRGRNQPLVKPHQLHPMRKSQGGMSFDAETVRAISGALKQREAAGQGSVTQCES